MLVFLLPLKQKTFCKIKWIWLWNRNTSMWGALGFCLRGVSWCRQPGIFTNHWTTNDLKVAGDKSLTIIYFFLSEKCFCEKIVSLSNNDRFDKIFLPNIWHFPRITRINYVSIFSIIILKINKRTLLYIWTIRNSYCEVQSVI